MPKVALYSQGGQAQGEVELADAVFGIEPNQHVLREVVLAQQASLRRGTHAVKNRSAVRGGGAKPWRQKGTGNARHGSRRSPIWVGGGVVFGPTPRSYSYKPPKKVRRLAIRSALSSKVQEDSLRVVDSIELEQPKTKEMVRILEQLNAGKKVLIVTATNDENVQLSSRNIPGVKVINANQVNVYDVLRHDALVMTKDAVKKVEEVFA